MGSSLAYSWGWISGDEVSRLRAYACRETFLGYCKSSQFVLSNQVFPETAVHFYGVKVGLIYEASSTDGEAIPSSETLKFTQQCEPYL